MSDWYTNDTEPQPDGFVGGDGACESVSLRFMHKTEPAAIVVYMYVVDREERTGEEQDYPFDYEEQVHYAVYGSEAERDECGEPVWDSYTYDNPSARSWDTEVDAEDYRDAEAARWLDMGTSHFIAWDGKIPN